MKMPVAQGIPIPARVTARAFTKWTPGRQGCRISTYSVASHGYSQIGWQDGKHLYCTTVHRAAWTHVHGQIPKGMTVDHKPTCDRRCVNVKHLRLLTNFENARRNGRDWPLGQCINGHPNSELIVADGGRRRRCRLCRNMYQRTYRRRKAAA